ncbi:hypothetical protein HBB16_01180 [Pseudonocardia sp. MCCB 268]|nr:hypothetical protein [Pseudonocardia cytotoxica]
MKDGPRATRSGELSFDGGKLAGRAARIADDRRSECRRCWLPPGLGRGRGGQPSAGPPRTGPPAAGPRPGRRSRGRRRPTASREGGACGAPERRRCDVSGRRASTPGVQPAAETSAARRPADPGGADVAGHPARRW